MAHADARCAAGAAMADADDDPMRSDDRYQIRFRIIKLKTFRQSGR